MSDGGIEGQPTGAGDKAGAQAFGSISATREAPSLRRSEVKNISPELASDTRSPFDSGDKPANDILESVKREGFDSTFKNLAGGRVSTGEAPKANKELPKEGNIVDFKERKSTIKKPGNEQERRPDEELAQAQKLEQDRQMEELLRQMEELKRQNKRLEEELKATQVRLQEATQSGIVTIQNVRKLTELEQKRVEADGFYEALLRKVQQKQAA